MRKIIGSLLLKLLGWKVVLEGDLENLNRCVLIVAPHTDNIEYLLGNLVYWKYNKPLRVIIKDTHTKAWYGFIVKALGGIGINRSQRNNLVQFVTELFKKEDFSLVICPEGTRSRVEKWKLGFYHMALSARVPIVFGGADFKTKKIHIGRKISVEDLETEAAHTACRRSQAAATIGSPSIHSRGWKPTAVPRTRATAAELRTKRYEHRPASER